MSNAIIVEVRVEIVRYDFQFTPREGHSFHLLLVPSVIIHSIVIYNIQRYRNRARDGCFIAKRPAVESEIKLKG